MSLWAFVTKRESQSYPYLSISGKKIPRSGWKSVETMIITLQLNLHFRLIVSQFLVHTLFTFYTLPGQQDSLKELYVIKGVRQLLWLGQWSILWASKKEKFTFLLRTSDGLLATLSGSMVRCCKVLQRSFTRVSQLELQTLANIGESLKNIKWTVSTRLPQDSECWEERIHMETG